MASTQHSLDQDLGDAGLTLSDSIFQKYNYVEIMAPVGAITKVSHRYTT